MRVLPAIDLIDGEAVRLFKGDYTEKTVYSSDPVAVAREFKEAGSRWLHLVDLNAAKGDARQLTVISKIIAESDLLVQVGGGIKKVEEVEALIGSGVSRVVLGTIAVKDATYVEKIIDKVGADKITIALDVVGGDEAVSLDDFFVATHGWQQKSTKTLNQMLDFYAKYDALNFLVTDVAKDGTLRGPNFNMYKSILETYPNVKVLVSGGVASLGDLESSQNLGADGVIVGKAIYERKFSVSDALAYEEVGDAE